MANESSLMKIASVRLCDTYFCARLGARQYKQSFDRDDRWFVAKVLPWYTEAQLTQVSYCKTLGVSAGNRDSLLID